MSAEQPTLSAVKPVRRVKTLHCQWLTSMSRIVIEPATPPTEAAAYEMLGRHSSSIAARRLGPSNDQFIFIARTQSYLVAAVAGRLAANQRGILYLPDASLVSNSAAVEPLLRQAHAWFDSRGAKLVQTLVEADVWTPLLEAMSYEITTEILLLEALTSHRSRCVLPEELELERVEPAFEARLVQVLADTYVGSEDLVPLAASTGAADNLRDYLLLSDKRAIWWVLRRGKQDVGALLIGNFDEQTAELLYVGLVPEQRRHGYALAAISYALYELHRRGLRALHLLVDIANDAAINCYVAAGFFQTSRRKMLVARR